MTINLSSTPETDLFFDRQDTDWYMEVAFAQNMERNRDWWKAEAESFKNEYNDYFNLFNEERRDHKKKIIELRLQTEGVKTLVIILKELLAENMTLGSTSQTWLDCADKIKELEKVLSGDQDIEP